MRFAPTLAAAALAAAGLTFIPSSAHAATTTTPAPEAAAAASWLSQASGVNRLIPGSAAGETSSWSYSMNLDYGVGLVQTGLNTSPAAVRLRRALDQTVTAWIGDAADGANVGKVAHAAYYYAISGGDPSDVGPEHLDLSAAVEADVDDATGQAGPSDSVYNQVWAVQALNAVDSSEVVKARDFLVGERGPAADDVWGYDSNGWVNDSDATSWALQALAPWSTATGVKSAIDAGVHFLAANQGATGGVAAPPYVGENAASTGLAAVALGEVGRTAEAARAATWLAAHQVTASCTGTAANVGAIAADDDALADGVDDDTIEAAAEATAQALAGLVYLPTSTATLSAPAGFAAAGSTISLVVGGLRAGQPACLVGTKGSNTVAGNGHVAIALPAGTATRTFTLSTVGSTTSVAVKALSATTLTATAPKKIKRGKKIAITVRGLAPAEVVTVKLGKVTLGKATANSAGHAVLRAIVAKKTAAGKKPVTVQGAFANRTGKTTVKVTR